MLEIKPIHLMQAKDFIKRYHRHNIPPVGGKFAVACWDDDTMCGVAICGRPIARHSDDGETLEIYRNCTDGTPNACTKVPVSASHGIWGTRGSSLTPYCQRAALACELQTFGITARPGASSGAAQEKEPTTYHRRR